MWQVVSGIGILQVIASCKRRHRTQKDAEAPDTESGEMSV
jgi:hypothetical protein